MSGASFVLISPKWKQKWAAARNPALLQTSRYICGIPLLYTLGWIVPSMLYATAAYGVVRHFPPCQRSMTSRRGVWRGRETKFEHLGRHDVAGFSKYLLWYLSTSLGTDVLC